jgi:hypothetical protein
MSKHTPGPWRVFICDDGKEWSGWPLSIVQDKTNGKNIVRPGGQWPYDWDESISCDEAIANAYLIAAAPKLLTALIFAKEMMIANDLNLPRTFEIIDEAIAEANGSKVE